MFDSSTSIFFFKFLNIKFKTYLANVLGLGGPGADLPLGLQVTVLPGLAYNAGGSSVGELDAVFSQVKIVQSVFLTGDTSQGTINKNLMKQNNY